MSSVELLKHLALQCGCKLLGFSLFKNKWEVYILNYKHAGRQPVFEECRDSTDFDLSMKQWIKRGTTKIASHASFEKAIENAIIKLEKEQ